MKGDVAMKKISGWMQLLGGIGAVFSCVAIEGAEPSVRRIIPEAPPPSVPIQYATDRVDGAATPVRSASLAALPSWDIGNPTDEEQEFLEWLNDARMDPVGEIDRMRDLDDPMTLVAYEYFKVDLDVFATQMAIHLPVAPLAMQSQLTLAARGHSHWMLENVEQRHDQFGVTSVERIEAQGYPWNAAGENIFSAAHSVANAHASFEVDWGLQDPITEEWIAPGIQVPPGHRISNHNAVFREVGIGYIAGNNQKVVNGETMRVGPYLVTVNFGSRSQLPALVLGVVYYDLNESGRYEAGEGISGIRIEVSDGTHEAMTPTSGGYAIPAGGGSRSVRFWSGSTLFSESEVVIEPNVNQRLNVGLPYTPPEAGFALAPEAGRAAILQLPFMPGVTRFDWEWFAGEFDVSTIGAEVGEVGYQTLGSPGYSMIQTERRASGQRAFHFASPTADDQVLLFTSEFFGGMNPRLKFSSALAGATETQIASAETSTDGGITWQSVWDQTGNGFPGETAFASREVSLGALSGEAFRLRFRYRVNGGSYYYQTETSLGFLLDDIQIIDAGVLNELSNGQGTVGQPIFTTPPQEGELLFRVRPWAGDRVLPWGPYQSVSVAPAGTNGDVTVEVASIRMLSGGRLELLGQTDGSIEAVVLLRARELGDVWETVQPVLIEATGGSGFRIEWQPDDTEGWFRLMHP